MLEPGDRVPEATVWLAPREPVSVRELAADVPILLFFYLFDWSST
jgi:peroxiredoxin